MPRPRLFVGSSSEGLAVAQAIQGLLDPICEVSLWAQDVFGLTHGDRPVAADSALQITRLGAPWLEREWSVEPSPANCMLSVRLLRLRQTPHGFTARLRRAPCGARRAGAEPAQEIGNWRTKSPILSQAITNSALPLQRPDFC
jgi:hypothetical protein